VLRRDGTYYQTAFHECAGCSVMFTDPTAFNASEPGPPQSAEAKLPPAPPDLPLKTYGTGAAAAPPGE
jgi:hypothetical protein